LLSVFKIPLYIYRSTAHKQDILYSFLVIVIVSVMVG